MPPLPRSPLLENALRALARRYRVPSIPSDSAVVQSANPATTLAVAIEEARVALAGGNAPDATLKRVFVETLARMIHDAMRTEHGDPVFQAMLLRHRVPRVREYASLSAHADRDRRRVRTAIDAIAHPAKAQRLGADPQRQALTRLHALASSASWTALAAAARQLLHAPDTPNAVTLEGSLTRLLGDPALERLQRLEALSSDELVRQHRSLLDRNAPRSGSPEAAAQGRTTQRRGAAVEALAAQALETLARRLNQMEGYPNAYRVVTSMRVAASLPGDAARAKTEWDAVLLRQAQGVDTTPVWNVCLLVEAKASVDAATTDFPRLLRGLRLLAHAQENTIYPFTTRQGVVRLRGASLHALDADADDLAGMVLYCSDAPAEAAPRLLSAASRMQLLSAPASLAYASRLAQNQVADCQDLAPVWLALLESPRWHAVLHQYATLRRARELMVHVEDLSAST